MAYYPEPPGFVHYICYGLGVFEIKLGEPIPLAIRKIDQRLRFLPHRVHLRLSRNYFQPTCLLHATLKLF